MRVVENNIVLIPLYHGTSELFLPSIRSTGLGSRNINEEYRLIEMLQAIVEIAPDLIEEPDFALWALAIRYTLNPDLTIPSFNYRYGSTYLSASAFTATNYAMMNIGGSELLSTVLNCLKELTAHDSNRADDVAKRFPAVADLVDRQFDPVLIEVKNVPVQMLGAEHRDKSARDVLREIQKIIDDGVVVDGFLQQENFQLLGGLSEEHLKFSRIEETGQGSEVKLVPI